jgi:predicted AAA+ superfamily ATPase
MLRHSRLLNLPKLLKNKSFFLFGARATGESSLIDAQLGGAQVFNLLDSEVFNDLLRSPRILEEANRAVSPDGIVVIDEIQKLPSLLDEVHRIIAQGGARFLLTGSSARKLRRGGANLLAGRAWQAELFPLCSQEIKDFDLLIYLNSGGLPAIYGRGALIKEELRSYVGTYLKEEIQAESLTRNLPAIASFLDAIALANGQEINYESLASDCGVSPVTLKSYISILEDTLIGFSLPGFKKTKKRKAITRAKHYMFDIGVVNQLTNRGEIKERSEILGYAFEHFVVLEVRAWNSYSRSYKPLTYWRSTSQHEVNLIIGDEMAVEIKATDLVQDKHLKGLRALKEEGLIRRYSIVSNDQIKRVTDDGITIYPWREFLAELWGSGAIS